MLHDVHRLGTLTETEDAPGLLDGHVVRHALLLLDGVAASRKDNVELLKRAFLGLDEEEVDDGEEGEVEDGEDDVLSNYELVVDGWRCGRRRQERE